MTTLPLDFAALRGRCAGAVLGPDDPAYDHARLGWNVAVDQRPVAVVFPADARDVATVLATARAAGLRVAVQGTGHGAAALGDLSEVVLVRTGALTGVEIDPHARTARAGAGALWRDVVPAAAEHGLAPVAGTSPDVGVAGSTLGGGIGYLSRAHGLASHHVTAVELVTVAGEPLRVTGGDLLWALRGGGIGLGVVTAIEFAVHPVTALYAGALFWPWEDAAAVLGRWAELTRDAPRTLTSMARILQLPPFPEVPAPLRGRAVVNVQLAYLGDAAEGAALVAPLRALGPEIDTVAPRPPEDLLRLHGEPEAPTPSMTDHALLDALPAAALDTLVALCGAGSGSPLTCVELRHLGGALRDAPAEAGALATLDAEYALHTVGVPQSPAATHAIGGHAAALKAALAGCATGRAYANFAGAPLDAAAAFAPDAHARLAALRARLDPDGLLVTAFSA